MDMLKQLAALFTAVACLFSSVGAWADESPSGKPQVARAADSGGAAGTSDGPNSSSKLPVGDIIAVTAIVGMGVALAVGKGGGRGSTAPSAPGTH